MKRTKKRLVSLALTAALLLTLWGGWPVMALADELSDPFATMYDSETLVQEALLRDPLFGASADSFMLELAVQEKLMREERMDLQMDNVQKETGSDSSSLSRKTGMDLALVKTSRYQEVKESLLLERKEKLRAQYETERFIVKYKSESSRSLDTMTTNDTQSVRLLSESGARIERLTLPYAVNPQDLALELQSAGAGREIDYIQPDFTLSFSSLSLELQETVEIPDEQFIEDIQPEIPDEQPAEDKLSEILQGDPPADMDTPVLVAVLDTGMDIEHEMLSSYVTEGYNALDGTATVYDPDRSLSYAHGTHIAGIIAQTAGETDVNLRILPIQVFDGGVAYTSDILAGIAYAREQGASIVNCSFGSTADNPALYETIRDSGMLFVCATGNNRQDMAQTPSYPAAYRLDNVISVASVNADGGFSYFSNYGADIIDISALGRDIVSAFPGGEAVPMTGTSMAAAQVTGASAAVQSLTGITDVAELRLRLLDTADRLDNLQDKVSGGRRLSLPNALAGTTSDEMLSLNPAEDFDAHGYHPTAGEQFDLYAAAGQAVKVAAGGAHTLVLKADGTVWAWGDNTYGQLGNGTNISRTTPVQVIGLSNVVSIAAGGSHSFAIRGDGTLWAWGLNNYGQLGINSNQNKSSPQQVWLYDAEAVVAGAYHSMALDSGGELYVWGDNTYCQLGSSWEQELWVPEINWYLGGPIFTIIGAGSYNCMTVQYDGQVFTWGNDNRYPNQSGFYFPGQVVDVTGGGYGNDSLALSSEKMMYTFDDYVSFSLVTNNAIGVSAGLAHSMVLKTDGTVWTWGENASGQLGDGTTTARNNLIQVGGLTGATAIAAGHNHSVALKADGSVWTWGNNTCGQLGDGTNINQLTPVQVSFGVTLQITPNSIEIPQSGSVTATALGQVYDGSGNFLSGQTVSYSLVTTPTGVSINGTTGVITISSAAQAGTVTVKATCGALSGTATLTLAGGAAKVETTMLPTSVNIPSSGSVTSTATAKVYDAANNLLTGQTVTYSLTATTTGVSINSSTGVVTVLSTAAAGAVTVKATCGAVSGTATLTLAGKVAKVEVTLSPTSLALPQNSAVTSTATAKVYDAANNLLTGQTVSYSLTTTTTGVSINSTTGVITVSTAAKVGTVTVRGTCGTVSGTAVLTLALPKVESLVIAPTSDGLCTVAIKGTGLTNFSERTFILTYDTNKLILQDLAAQTVAADLSAGSVAGTPLTIVSHANGVLKFTVEKNIPVDNVWSGVLTVLRFKVLGTATITLQSVT